MHSIMYSIIIYKFIIYFTDFFINFIQIHMADADYTRGYGLNNELIYSSSCNAGESENLFKKINKINTYVR